MIIGIISFLIAVAGFFFLVYPRVSVSPGTSLDTRNPFKTPFVIKNDGYLPLYNIKYSLIAENMETTFGKFIDVAGSTGQVIDKLNPNKSSTLFVDRIFHFPPNIVKYAQIYIRITYRPTFLPFNFTENIRFKTEIRSNGEYVWYESYEKH